MHYHSVGYDVEGKRDPARRRRASEGFVGGWAETTLCL